MQNLPCQRCAEAMERLLLTIARMNGFNSELFKDMIAVLEQALSMARASRSPIAPTIRCQFCLLAPEIARYDTSFLFESLTCSRISIAERIQSKYDSMTAECESASQFSVEESECRTLKAFLQVSVSTRPIQTIRAHCVHRQSQSSQSSRTGYQTHLLR